jgi:hypothetical protein
MLQRIAFVETNKAGTSEKAILAAWPLRSPSLGRIVRRSKYHGFIDLLPGVRRGILCGREALRASRRWQSGAL